MEISHTNGVFTVGEREWGRGSDGLTLTPKPLCLVEEGDGAGAGKSVGGEGDEGEGGDPGGSLRPSFHRERGAGSGLVEAKLT